MKYPALPVSNRRRTGCGKRIDREHLFAVLVEHGNEVFRRRRIIRIVPDEENHLGDGQRNQRGVDGVEIFENGNRGKPALVTLRKLPDANLCAGH